MADVKKSPYATVPFILNGVVGYCQKYKLPLDAKIISAREAIELTKAKNSDS